MSIHKEKYCQRCNLIFECKAESILLCQCNKIELMENTKDYLQQNFTDCICLNCLKEIQLIHSHK